MQTSSISLALAGVLAIGAMIPALPAAGATAADASSAGATATHRAPISVEDLEARRAAAFARADADGDGLVSPTEFQQAAPPHPRHMPGPGPRHAKAQPLDAEAAAALDAKLFDTLDVNGDQVLSRAEFSHQALAAARMTLRREAMFSRLDTDGDGQLSPAEFPPGHLAQRDANGDGLITADELPQRGPGPHHPSQWSPASRGDGPG